MRGQISALVSTNPCLSSCYIYDREQCYRKFGSENIDWQSVAVSLFGVVPLGFILFGGWTKRRLGAYRRARHRRSWAFGLRCVMPGKQARFRLQCASAKVEILRLATCS